MSATTAWYDPAHTISVEYRPITWERIRRLSFDGLMSLPRVGLGVGGFLLGTRDARRIVVTDFSPIECSHASGPSFNPTTEEIAAARSAIKNTPLEVVGYYCSRPRRAIELTPKDEELFRMLCPETGQLFLLIRPSATEASRAALYFRKPDGTVQGGTEYPLDPLASDVSGVPASAEVAEVTQTPVPVVERPLKSAPAPPTPEPIRNVRSEPAPARPISKPQPKAPRFTEAALSEAQFTAPQFAEPIVTEPRFRGRPQIFGDPAPVPAPAFTSARETRAIPWRNIGIVAATLAIAAGSWITRDQWAPRPALELHAAETGGHFSLEWNRAAIRGIGTAMLKIGDGTISRTIMLDGRQLEAGTFSYARVSPVVTAELVAGDAHAEARFVAPPQPVVPAIPGDAAGPTATTGASQGTGGRGVAAPLGVPALDPVPAVVPLKSAHRAAAPKKGPAAPAAKPNSR